MVRVGRDIVATKSKMSIVCKIKQHNPKLNTKICAQVSKETASDIHNVHCRKDSMSQKNIVHSGLYDIKEE